MSWTGQNPAGLADDVRDDYRQLTVAAHGAQGTYRVATIPASISAVVAEYAGWRRLGQRSAVVGRVMADRGAQAQGNWSVLLTPDRSSPFAPAVTNAPATAYTRVVLEGGQGVRLGAWRLGLALGFDGNADNAQRSRIAMTRRAAHVGGRVGVGHTLGADGRIGLFVHRASHNETANLFQNPGTPTVYLMDGFLNVNAEEYGLGSPFFRRVDREAWSTGGAYAGTLWSGRWSAWAQRNRSDERQVAIVAANAPTSRWTGEGEEGGIAMQRAWGGLTATSTVRVSTHRGASRRARTTPREFTSDESSARAMTNVQWANVAPGWTLALLAAVGRDRYAATDRAARTTLDVTAWSPSATVELVRHSARRGAYSAGIGMARYAPFASIPSAAARGDGYLKVLAPAFEIAAAPARSVGLSLAGRWSVTGRDVIARASWATTSATKRAMDAYFLPPGARAQWSIGGSIAPHRTPPAVP